MALTSARDVITFPAIFQAVNRPLAISPRNDAALIEPSGKASRATTSSRSGVVSLTCDASSARRARADSRAREVMAHPM
jgi:hypothetical protein